MENIPSTEKSKILIAEDEPVSAKEIEYCSKRLGYEVISIVDTAEAAIEKIAMIKPDVVLFSIGLRSEKNCLEAAHKIVSGFRMPIIFLATIFDKEKIDQADDKMFYGYILKPVHHEALRIAVKAALRIAEIAEEKKQVEELLIQSEKIQSIAGLAPSIVHEIKNPLSVIYQGTQNILRRLSPDQKSNAKPAREFGIDLQKLKLYLEKREINPMLLSVQESVMKADRIITGMLEFSRKSESKMIPVNLAALIEGALELAGKDYYFNKKHDFKKINIIKEFSPDLPLTPCIEVEIEQVILNLIRNAAWSLFQTKKDIAPRITIRLYAENESVRIEVEDNGPGMDETIRSHVFDPFYTTKPKGEGTGLGLSVSKMIIHNKHGGTMEVESEVGKGTIVTIRLPLDNERH